MSQQQKVKIRFKEEVDGASIGEVHAFDQNTAQAYVAEGLAEILANDPEVQQVAVLMQKAVDQLDSVDGGKTVSITIPKEKPVKHAAARIFTRIAQAEEFANLQPVFFDRSGLWWLWNTHEKFWELVDEIDILNLIQKTIGIDTINATIRNEILQALKQVGRLNLPKPTPITWIQFKNGIVDVNADFALVEPSPKYFITNPIPWEVSDSEDTPNMDRIFTEWVGEEYRDSLYEILAYCLLPDYPVNRIFCFIGAGMNGKSKYLDLLRRFIGFKNVTCTELDVLIGSRFEVTRLHRKLVCQMGETNFSAMDKTSILKKLSGGDLIGFEYKGKTPFEDKNYAKLLISTNNLPTTSDKTIGFYRRWMIIDFPNQFTEARDILADIPDHEYRNLARKSIRILKELLVRRKFTNEGDIEERMRRYEDRSDPLEKFISEYVVENPEAFIWKAEFERKLNEWCRENRFRTMSEVVIGRKMKEKGIKQEHRQMDWLQEGQEKRARVWVGITWRETK